MNIWVLVVVIFSPNNAPSSTISDLTWTQCEASSTIIHNKIVENGREGVIMCVNRATDHIVVYKP